MLFLMIMIMRQYYCISRKIYDIICNYFNYILYIKVLRELIFKKN